MKQKHYAFSNKAIQSPTPTWAKNVFRVTTILTTAVSFWIASTSMVSQDMKVEIILDLKVFDLIVLGLSKMFGVTPSDEVVADLEDPTKTM